MEEVSITKLRATWPRVLERVRTTRKPVLVTRFGKPVAGIVPPPPPTRPKNWLGDMVGTGRIVGDIVGPVVDEEDWDVLRP